MWGTQHFFGAAGWFSFGCNSQLRVAVFGGRKSLWPLFGRGLLPELASYAVQIPAVFQTEMQEIDGLSSVRSDKIIAL
jgi:hypothetical protein